MTWHGAPRQPPVGGDLADCLVKPLSIACNTGQRGIGLGKPVGDGPPNAAEPAGDDGQLTGQVDTQGASMDQFSQRVLGASNRSRKKGSRRGMKLMRRLTGDTTLLNPFEQATQNAARTDLVKAVKPSASR